MGLNRYIDRKIDALNPRTSKREIPAGSIKPLDALLFSLISLLILVFSAYKLNPLCLKLSPIAIILITGYSYTKRFTWLAHFVLGVALSIAPAGVWIAVRGSFDWQAMPLVLSVVFWLPGFDILYALQDEEFDRSHGLYSVPARFGTRKSLFIARGIHTVSWLFLVLNGVVNGLGYIYWLGMTAVGALFIYEHSIIRESDLSRLGTAFMNMNGYISLSVLIFTAADLII